MIRSIRLFCGRVAIAGLVALTGCREGSAPDQNHHPQSGNDHHEEANGESARSNHIDIPPAVRSNLGISFVTVERRRIEQTLRVPGRFEYLPTARREYRTMLPGRIELLVEQFDRVERGTALYRIDSPAWREMQQKLA
jgi:multidrug efflux pump subunit AcrA (membrane-fusion protein)